MWTQSPLKWPNAAQTIQTQSETVTGQVGSTMSSAATKLKSLESDANYGRHPLSTDAEALTNLRTNLQNLLRTGTVITASPYQFQVGNSLSSGKYLNPQTAVETLVKKLRDKADIHRPTQTINCVAIMLTASQQSEFVAKLADITSVYPLPDWCQTYRQAKVMLTNEVDKFHQPAAIAQPRFKPAAQLNTNPLKSVEHHQGSQIATLESLASDKTNVIAKLSTLATKRGSKLAQVKAQIEALKALKGSVWSVKLSGTPESIASQLSQIAPPNNHQHTVASLILSQHPLTFWEELLCSV